MVCQLFKSWEPLQSVCLARQYVHKLEHETFMDEPGTRETPAPGSGARQRRLLPSRGRRVSRHHRPIRPALDQGLSPRRCRRIGGQAAARSPTHLNSEQTRRVLDWFRHSPKAFGFRTELWTARRVAWLIEKHFGVVFHPRYLNAW